ncbi:MAG: DNRLRE domain-containing protein [Actinobacteria bacterium]|nr:DNRLRE domain-containing protein [Actinomycetota bacterium]
MADGAWRPIVFGDSPADLLRVELAENRTVRVAAPELSIAKPLPDPRGGGVVYRDVATDTDLQFLVAPAGVTKKLVLKSPDAPHSFTFELIDPNRLLGELEATPTGGLQASRLLEGGVRVELPPPFAYEDVGEGHVPVAMDPASAHLAVEPIAHGWKLVVSVDERWLEGRSYPIVLDPTINFSDGSGLVMDAYTYRQSEGCGGCWALNTTDIHLGAGSWNEDGYDIDQLRSFLRFDLSQIPAGSTINSATFSAHLRACLGSTFRCNEHDYSIELRELTGGWDATSTWDELAAITAAQPFATYDRPAWQSGLTEWHDFDVSSQVEAWVTAGAPFNGFALMLGNEATTVAGPMYDSSRHSSGNAPRIVVDYTPPPPAPTVSSVTHPDEGAWYPSNEVELAWSIDNGADIAGYTWTLDTSATTIPVDTNPTTTPSVTLPGLDDGEWWFHVRAQRSDGLWSGTAHFRVGVDTASPDLSDLKSMTHPDPASWYVSDDPRLSWTATDATSGVAGYAYTINRVPTTQPSAQVMTTAPSRSFFNLAAGEWWFHVRAVDRAGGASATSHHRIRIDDALPPLPEVLAGSTPRRELVDTFNPRVWWRSSPDADSELAGYSWAFNQSEDESADTVRDGDPDVTFSNAAGAKLAAGEWWFHVRAIDKAGNATPDVAYGPMLLGGASPAPPAPAVFSQTHPSQNLWRASRDLYVEWNVLVSGVQVDGYSYVLDQLPGTEPDAVSEGTAASQLYTGLSDGEWWFHVRARNVAGLWGRTGHYRVRIDATAPAAPAVTLPTHPDPDAWHPVAGLVAELTPPASVAPVREHRWAIDQVPDTVPTQTTSDRSILASVDDGVWWLHARARDAAGNLGTTAHVRLAVNTGSYSFVKPGEAQSVWSAVELSALGPASATSATFQVAAATESTWRDVAVTDTPAADGTWQGSWDTTSQTNGAADFPDGTYRTRVVFDLDGQSAPPLIGPQVTVGNGLSAAERVEADHQAGILDQDDRALYGVYALTNPDRLPDRYRTTDMGELDADQAGMQFLQSWDDLTQATRDAITDHLTVKLDGSTASTLDATTQSTLPKCPTPEFADAGLILFQCRRDSANFTVRYRVEGLNTVQLTDFFDASLNRVSNGVPDIVDRVLWSLEEARRVYDDMGYLLPPPRTQVLLTAMPDGGGWVPPLPFAEESIWMDNGTVGINLPIHEFFHVVQLKYYSMSDWSTDYLWWGEATAEWATMHVFVDLEKKNRVPADDDGLFNDAEQRGRYANDIGSVLSSPHKPLNDISNPFARAGRAYGSFVFATHLEDRFGTDVIRQIWDIVGDGFFDNSIQHSITETVENHGSSFPEVVANFWRDTYRYPVTYADAMPGGLRDPEEIWRRIHLANNPKPKADRRTIGQSRLQGSGEMSPGGAHYVEFSPTGPPGLLRVEVRTSRERDVTVVLAPSGAWPSGCVAGARTGVWVDNVMTLEVHMPADCDLATLVIAFGARPDQVLRGVDVSWTADYFHDYQTLASSSVELGLTSSATLGAPASNDSPHRKSPWRGVRSINTGNDGLSEPVNPCEGWGILDFNSGISTGVNRCHHLLVNLPGGVENLDIVDFDSSGTTATSTIDVTSFDRDVWLRVTHQYSLTGDPRLFKVRVTLANRGSTTIDPLYRRVMDWDVEKANYAGVQFITNQHTFLTGIPDDVVLTTKGTEHPDPQIIDSFNNSDHRIDYGENMSPPFGSSADYGVQMDLLLSSTLGQIAPGKSISFDLFVGAAPDQFAAKAALDGVEANVQVLAEEDSWEGANLGMPQTFMLGYISKDSDSL